MASYQSYPLLQNVKLTPAPGSIVGGNGPATPVGNAPASFGGNKLFPHLLPAPAAPAGTGQLTPAQIQQQIGHYVSTLPTAMTPGQISTQAQNEIAPQIGALSKALQGQVANASTAINGYTQDLAAKLGAVNYGAPYAQAESQQAAVDSALSQALAGGGTQNAQDLQARLAQIQEPGATGAAANAVQANATGNSNTVLGAGSSNLGQLLADAAAAKSYGQKLPGIASLAGVQQLANVQGNANQALADGTQKIQAELPGILDNLRSSSDTNATNRTNLATHINEYLTGQNQSIASGEAKARQVAQQLYIEQRKLGQIAKSQSFDEWYKAQQVGVARTNAATSARTADARITQGQQNANTAAARAATAANTAAANTTLAQQRLAVDLQRVRDTEAKTSAAQAPRFNASISRSVGYRADQYGNPVGGKVSLLPGYAYNAKGDIVKASAATASGKSHGLSADKVQTKTGTALNLAETAFKGGTDSKGNTLPPLTFSQAVLEAEKEGLPAWIYLPALNSFYRPGGKNSPLDGPPAPGGKK